MQKIAMRIEIVSSALARFSSMSLESRHAILTTLAKHYSDVRITLINDASDLSDLAARQPDLVFLGMSSIVIEDELGFGRLRRVWLSDFLDELDITYTGSQRGAHELEHHKPLAKQRVLDAGLDTSPYLVAENGRMPILNGSALTYPLFIKPTDRGGGTGVDSRSVTHNVGQAQAKINSIAAELKSDALIEAYLPGREFSVAILRETDAPEFLAMPIELVASEDENGVRILSSAIKHANSEWVSAVSQATTADIVSRLALACFKTLGGRDYGRIDIRLDKAGRPQFLEANLIPSLIDGYGSFPKACLINQGLSHEAMLIRIVTLALARLPLPVPAVAGSLAVDTAT